MSINFKKKVRWLRSYNYPGSWNPEEKSMRLPSKAIEAELSTQQRSDDYSKKLKYSHSKGMPRFVAD